MEKMEVEAGQHQPILYRLTLDSVIHFMMHDLIQGSHEYIQS